MTSPISTLGGTQGGNNAAADTSSLGGSASSSMDSMTAAFQQAMQLSSEVTTISTLGKAGVDAAQQRPNSA